MRIRARRKERLASEKAEEKERRLARCRAGKGRGEREAFSSMSSSRQSMLLDRRGTQRADVTPTQPPAVT